MGIFSEEELQADATNATGEVERQEETQQEVEQRERDEAGRFKAKDEVEPERTPEGEAPSRKDGTVPQGALHAEREKRKSIENELKAAREQLASIAKLREQVATRQPEPLPPADDPAAIEHLRQRLAQQEQQINRFGQHLDTQAIEQAEAQQLQAVMIQSETAYRQEAPDYDNAISHVVQARAQELALYGLTPPQIQQTISEEATEIVRSAIQQGRNPAELGYQIALSRGYRPTQGGQEEQAPVSGAQRQLAAIGAAKGQSRSLGQAAGSTPRTLNAESIAAMDADEFERLYSTPEGKAMIDAL